MGKKSVIKSYESDIILVKNLSSLEKLKKKITNKKFCHHIYKIENNFVSDIIKYKRIVIFYLNIKYFNTHTWRERIRS